MVTKIFDRIAPKKSSEKVAENENDLSEKNSHELCLTSSN